MIYHPYNFVPLTRPVVRKPWPQSGPFGHERFDQLSGTLHCVLVTDSLLTIKANFEKFFQQGRPPQLPGSSLKGMIRNVLEMLGVGCSRFFLHDQRDMQTNLARLEPCTEEEACVACRVFGYSVEGKEFGWAGKVRFHDSSPAENWPPTRWKESPPGMARLHSYGTRHKPFYYPDASHPNDPAGWKVYRHASHPTGAHHDFQVKACVGARESFNFRIDYENLTPEEFTLLHFALTLRHQCERHSPEIRLLHKLGYGKGLGLGSCHIEIDRVEPENVKRYFPNQPGPPVPQPDSSLEPYLATPAFAAMAKLLAQGSSQELEYPGEWWFADAKLKPLSIAEYEAEANRRKPPAVSPPLPPPEGEPHADLPKRVQVRITRLDAGGIRGETLQAYEGHKYTCRARGRPYGREKGDECMVEVDRASVDHSKHFFEGKAIA